MISLVEFAYATIMGVFLVGLTLDYASRHLFKKDVLAVPGFREGFLFFFGTVLIGGVLYFLNPSYILGGFFYHLLILTFPLSFLWGGRNSLRAIGLTRGNPKDGLGYSLLFGAVMVGSLVLRSAAFGGQPTIRIFSLLSLDLVTLVPVAEELFFRGFLYTKIRDRYENRTFVISTTAVAYAIFHIPRILFFPTVGLLPYLPPEFSSLLYLVPVYLGLGLVFGIIREGGKSVYYPMMFHAVYNLAVLMIVT